MSKPPIPSEVARRLCEHAQQANGFDWQTYDGLMCWGCVRFSNGDFARMSASSQSDYRGCILVNKLYETSTFQS